MSNTPNQATHNSKLSQMEENAIQEFSDLITARMADGKAKGMSDWSNVGMFSNISLYERLQKAIKDNDWGSVGAYAMMAHHRGLVMNIGDFMGSETAQNVVSIVHNINDNAPKHD